MKKIRYIVLTVLIVFLLVLFGFVIGRKEVKPEAEKEKLNNYAGYETYENNNWGFSIKYPKNWKREILIENAVDFGVSFQDLVVFAFLPEPQGFDEMVQEGILKISKNSTTKIDVTNQKKLVISGYPAYLLEYSISDAITEFKYIHYFVNGEKIWYQILYATEKENYLTFIDEVEKAIESFTINEI